MKKIFFVLLTISLVMACVGCGSANTTTDNYSNESITNLESAVEDNIPDEIEGLIDMNEKPYTDGKIFYNSLGREIKFFTSDNEGTFGTYSDGYSKGDWNSNGNGIYSYEFLRTYRYFMHNGFLVLLDSDDFGTILVGDSDNGFSGGVKHCFFEDGRYEFHPGKAGVVTTTGAYTMISKNIMKLIRVTDSEKRIDYYFIAKNGAIYNAYSQNKNDYI